VPGFGPSSQDGTIRAREW